MPAVTRIPITPMEMMVTNEDLVRTTILKVLVQMRIIWISSCSLTVLREDLCNIGALKARSKLRTWFSLHRMQVHKILTNCHLAVFDVLYDLMPSTG